MWTGAGRVVVASISLTLTVPHLANQMKVQAMVVITIIMMIDNAAPNGQLLATPN